jgi:hypothetical protein
MSELTLFVHDALGAGKSREEVRTVLLQAGWRQDEVMDALGEFAEVDFPIPVPRRKPYLSARDAFLHLVAFLTLYISALGLGTLLFQVVNLLIPDPLQRAGQSGYHESLLLSAIRWAAACVIIAFPVYLGISRLLHRSYEQDPARRASPIRKWLTYVTLFVTAATVISYLIALVSQLLGGELAVQFALKVAIVAAIAAAVFGYYLPGLRQEEKEA